MPHYQHACARIICPATGVLGSVARLGRNLIFRSIQNLDFTTRNECDRVKRSLARKQLHALSCGTCALKRTSTDVVPLSLVIERCPLVHLITPPISQPHRIDGEYSACAENLTVADNERHIITKTTKSQYLWSFFWLILAILFIPNALFLQNPSFFA